MWSTNDRRFRRMAKLAGTGIAALALAALVSAGAQTPDQFETTVKAAYAKFKDLHEGKNADYIPALAKVDPNLSVSLW
jgi:glutaminase